MKKAHLFLASYVVVGCVGSISCPINKTAMAITPFFSLLRIYTCDDRRFICFSVLSVYFSPRSLHTQLINTPNYFDS